MKTGKEGENVNAHGRGKDYEQEGTERTEIGRKRTQRTQKIGNSVDEKRIEVGKGGKEIAKRGFFPPLPTISRLFPPFPT
jgi:hypothetical protein